MSPLRVTPRSATAVVGSKDVQRDVWRYLDFLCDGNNDVDKILDAVAKLPAAGGTVLPVAMVMP